MAFKSLLVYLDNDLKCADRVTTAASLSHCLNAHLAGVYIMQTIELYAYHQTYIPMGAYESMLALANEKRDLAKTEFTKTMTAENINAEFRTTEGRFINTLDVQSRYADLLVLPQRLVGDSDFSPEFNIADILLSVACPMLVLPESDGQPSLTRLPQRVMIAWDGSRESARALRDALPLLAETKNVDVVSVSSNETEATDIALHIARHGIETQVHLVEGSSNDAGETLINQAMYLNSELIIMGAYGHSRMREQILGGTTRHMLENSQLPLLFSH